MTTHIDCPWPNGGQGAVSLTFDDGLESQLKRAIPLLEERGLRGTFYLNPRGPDYAETLAPWQAVAEAGHEIGNHSLGHTCSRNFAFHRGARGLETMTLDDMEADVVEAERRLQEVLPRDTLRSFCYPCYMTHVGEGLTQQSYVPVVAKHFVAGRAAGEYGFANHPFNADLHCLAAIPAERMPGPEMVGLVERAARQGRWAIFAFHSIDGGRLGVAEFDFVELLDHLAPMRDRLWTAPVADVAHFLKGLREARTGGEKVE
jgi:hypothetical protein